MNEPLDDHPVLRTVAREEAIHAVAPVQDAHVVVTDRRLAVASNARLMLDVAIGNVRRIQFDIERRRPATLVVVPEHPADEPQALPVPPEEYRAVADVLVVLGEQLAGMRPAADQAAGMGNGDLRPE
jgi:hypothetical protein